MLFQQYPNDAWVAVRPDIAASVGLVPTGAPGEWTDQHGQTAARTVRWVDGETGHVGRHFDDAVAGGWAVVLTDNAVEGLVSRFGPLTRIHVLARMHSDDEATSIHAEVRDQLGRYGEGMDVRDG